MRPPKGSKAAKGKAGGSAKKASKGKKKKDVGGPAGGGGGTGAGGEGSASLGPAVWRPGQDGVDEGEALQYDPTAYDCLHALTLDWPCLRRAPKHGVPWYCLQGVCLGKAFRLAVYPYHVRLPARVQSRLACHRCASDCAVVQSYKGKVVVMSLRYTFWYGCLGPAPFAHAGLALPRLWALPGALPSCSMWAGMSFGRVQRQLQ